MASEGPMRRMGRPLPNETVTRLLQLGLAGPRRPVDALVDRLSMPDGASWFTQSLQRHPLKNIGDAEATLVHGRADLVALERLKEASKRLLHDAINENDRLTGLAGYFLAVAAALRHHNRIICSRSAEELHSVMLDLAAVAPAPWSDLLSAAALKAAPGEAR